MTRGATLFSGGGGVEARLKERIDFVHAVEYDAQIAAVYARNHGDHVQVADVCDVDYSLWGQLDYLHASPVCKNASQAKTGGEESDIDTQTAQAVVRCLEATQPRVFTLENVWGYRQFAAFRLICQALDRMGYMWHFEHLNAADFGVPQTRRRLILRAVRDSLLPGWPAPLPWVGWHAVIEDLIPTLPTAQFAQWQLDRLPAEMHGAGLHQQSRTDDGSQHPRWFDEPTYTVCAEQAHPKAFIVHANDQRSMPVRTSDEPMFTVTAASHSSHFPDTRPRAWLVDQQNGSRNPTVRTGDEPAFTLTQYSTKHPTPRAWLSAGRVVKMTPRALARFQSLPDSFWLPDKASLACTVIGNAVPSLLMQHVVEPLL